jgi:hypothetical protein
MYLDGSMVIIQDSVYSISRADDENGSSWTTVATEPVSIYAAGMGIVNGMLGEAVMRLVETHAAEGHSGCSSEIALALFDAVAHNEPLTPEYWDECSKQYTDMARDFLGEEPEDCAQWDHSRFLIDCLGPRPGSEEEASEEVLKDVELPIIEMDAPEEGAMAEFAEVADEVIPLSSYAPEPKEVQVTVRLSQFDNRKSYWVLPNGTLSAPFDMEHTAWALHHLDQFGIPTSDLNTLLSKLGVSGNCNSVHGCPITLLSSDHVINYIIALAVGRELRHQLISSNNKTLRQRQKPVFKKR